MEQDATKDGTDGRTDEGSDFRLVEQVSLQSQTGDEDRHGEADPGQTTGAKHDLPVHF